MNCSKCGHTITLNQRICPRCHYFREQDRYVDVQPPVHLTIPSADKAPGSVSTNVLKALQKEQEQRELRDVPFAMRYEHWGVACLLAVFPGLGHLFQKQRKKAWLYFIGVTGLFIASLVLARNTSFGIMLPGLAASLHAYSMFELTPMSVSRQPLHRIGTLAFFLAFLLTCVYTPVLSLFGNTFVETQVIRARRGSEGWAIFTYVVGYLFNMIFAFIAFFIIGALLAAILTPLLTRWQMYRTDRGVR